MNDLRLATWPQRNVFKASKNLPTRASDGTVHFFSRNNRKKTTGDTVKSVGDPVAAGKDDHNHFEAKWIKFRRKAKGWWNKLSDDDLEKVGGNFDQLIRLLQIKYGYSRQQAEAEYIKKTK